MSFNDDQSNNSDNDELLSILNDALEKPVGRHGETIRDYITTAIEDCIRVQGVDAWLPMGRKGGRLCVGLYFQGVAARICNEFSLDERTSKVALIFSLMNTVLFINADVFISELREIADYPAVLNNEDAYGSGNLLSIFQSLGAESAAEWIRLNFSKPFPTEKLRRIMDIVEEYAVDEVKNPTGNAAMNGVMKIISNANIEDSLINPTITETNVNGAFAMENISQQPPANGDEPTQIANSATDSDSQSFEQLMAQSVESNNYDDTTALESEPSRLDIILEFLAEEGFRPQKASETSVVFKYEGKRRWVDLDESDTTWYQVVAPNIWEIESEDELQKAYEAANLVNRSLKNVKAYVRRDGENVFVEFGSFYDYTDELLPHLLRMVKIVNSGVKKFTELMLNNE